MKIASMKISSFILLITFVLLSGCAAPQFVSTPSPTLTITPAPTHITPPTRLPDPQEVIVRSQCSGNGKASRSHVTIQMGEKVIQQVIESAPPDRIHIIGDDGETIIIGDMLYVLPKDKVQWIEYKINQPQSECQNGKLVGAISQAQYIGQDNIAGKIYQVIEYQYQKTQNGVELNQKNKIWVDLTDGFLYKLTTEGDMLSISSDNLYSSTQGSSTLVFERNPVVKIEKPEPVVTPEPTATPEPAVTPTA